MSEYGSGTLQASDVGTVSSQCTRYINVIHISHVIHPPGGKVAPDLKFTHQDMNDDIRDWFNSLFICRNACTGERKTSLEVFLVISLDTTHVRVSTEDKEKCHKNNNTGLRKITRIFYIARLHFKMKQWCVTTFISISMRWSVSSLF